MTNRIQKGYFIKGSSNEVSATLTEEDENGNDVAISVPSWTELSIDIGGLVLIERTSETDGVTFQSGKVGVTPGELTEDLTSLVEGESYRVRFVVKTASQPDGAVFGDGDSKNKLIWIISSNPDPQD